MPISRVSATEYATMIADDINSRDPTMDTSIGPIKDLRIDPFAKVLELQNNRIVYLSELTSFVNADYLVPDDVDTVVYNEGIIRWNGSNSIGVVSFARTQAPTVDLIVPVNFPLATPLDPKTGRYVIFRTIETKTMFAASASTYYNATTKKYELDVAVASLLTGVDTSVGAYSIKVLRRPFPGFDQVYNKFATVSGNPVETNQEIANRYLLHVKGSQLSTPDGNKSFILDNFSTVEDVYVVYGDDSNLLREESDAGAVDVWILGEAPLTRTYHVAYPGIETLMVVDRQPLKTIVSVTSGALTFVEGTDYEVVQDVGIYSRSSRGQDGIRFLAGATTLPANIGDDVVIQFQYNSLMDVLTSFFTQPFYFSMGMDKLFRWAQEKSIEIEADLKVSYGNPTTISASVSDALLNYINSLKLGDNVEEFDLDREVAKIKGVDNFTWAKLCVKDGAGVGDIDVSPSEYARIDVTDLIVNLV